MRPCCGRSSRPSARCRVRMRLLSCTRGDRPKHLLCGLARRARVVEDGKERLEALLVTLACLRRRSPSRVGHGLPSHAVQRHTLMSA
jgi:hypothetical protein